MRWRAKVFDIHSEADLKKIAPSIAMHMHKGRKTNIIINVLTDEFDTKRYKTTNSPKNQGGWRKHTYEVKVSGKGSFHVRSKPDDVKKLYIVDQRPESYYYSPPNIFGAIYWELGILEGNIIIEHITIKNEGDLLIVVDRFNAMSSLYNSLEENKNIYHLVRVDSVVENEKEFSDILQLLTDLTILKFAEENRRIDLHFLFTIDLIKDIRLEGLPLKMGIYHGGLGDQHAFYLDLENSHSCFDYKVPSKGYYISKNPSYFSENLIRNKVRKSRYGRDYIRPDETGELCTDGLAAFTIQSHRFVRSL